MSEKPFFIDKNIVGRIEDYFNHQKSKGILSSIFLNDVQATTEHLFSAYPRHYARTKKEALLCTVRKAITYIQTYYDTSEIDQNLELKFLGTERSVSESKIQNENLLNEIILNTYSQKSGENKLEKPIVKKKKYSNEQTTSKKHNFNHEIPKLNFSDFGGIENCLQDIRELIEYPLTHPEIFLHLGIEPARGILLHGPPGCGKTALAHAIAGELKVPLLKVSAPEIVSGMSGESEANIRELFESAKTIAPCLVFIDEIDAITPKRENVQKEMERRIVAQLLISIDELSSASAHVLVIGATNRPDSLDNALRRAGRFDREICLGVPDINARKKILAVKTKNLRIEKELDFNLLAQQTHGFVGADIEALCKEAAIIAINRIFKKLWINKKEVVPSILENDSSLTPKELEDLYIRMDDFLLAVSKVQPSLKREGFASIPDVTWKDIGALKEISEELVMTIQEPIKNPEKFASVGLSQTSGCLLYGPPGCGKTLLAKAVANESGASFISIKGPELLNKYVGESEKAIRLLFERARTSTPCILFFDELDALCPKRGLSENAVSVRVVNQLLTEMDGLDSRKQIFVIAATNRPDMIDPAMLRPGRLDKLLFVDLPTAQERAFILETLSRKFPISPQVSLPEIANDPSCEGFSGADLSAVVREATLLALKQNFALDSQVLVETQHFHSAIKKILPSVSKKDQLIYQRIQSKLRKARSHLSVDINLGNEDELNNFIE